MLVSVIGLGSGGGVLLVGVDVLVVIGDGVVVIGGFMVGGVVLGV